MKNNKENEKREKVRQQLDPLDLWNVFWSIVTWIGRLRTLYWLIGKFYQLFKQALARFGQIGMKKLVSNFLSKLKPYPVNVALALITSTRFVSPHRSAVIVMGANDFTEGYFAGQSLRSYYVLMKTAQH